MDQYHLEGIDPALDDCCRREVESNRVYNALTSTLNRHDVTVLAERRRRHVLHNLKFGNGCRCSYDPNTDGGEYKALMDLRQLVQQEEALEEKEEGEEEREPERNNDSDDDDGSDDEFDYLLDDDLPVENSDIEDRRRAELEFAMLTQETALQHGYGAHRQMHPSRVLKAAGLGVKNVRDAPHAVVLHLVHHDSVASASLDLCLEKLALQYKGTKFLRSLGRSTMLMDKELTAKAFPPNMDPDDDMPALLAIREGSVVAFNLRLQGLTDADHVMEHAVRDWLDHAHVLVERAPGFDQVCRIRPEEEALLDHMRAAREKEEATQRYNCGIPNCHKPFFHEHVGIETNQQDGLIVPEDTVVGDENATTVNI
jgi:hypothetical protein